MPPERDIVPRVRIYPRSFVYGADKVDATDWNGIARWTRDLSRERQVPTNEVAAKARALTAGLTDPVAKAQRIYEFVQKDRKSTRLNSSHGYISYAVFCLQ